METTDNSPEPPPGPLPFDCGPPTQEELNAIIEECHGLIVAGCTKFWRQFRDLGYTVDDLVGDMVLHAHHIREKIDPKRVPNLHKHATNRKEALRSAFCSVIPRAVHNKLINELRNRKRPLRDLLYYQKGDGEIEDKCQRMKGRELSPPDQLIIREAYGTTDEIADKLNRLEKESIEKYPHRLHTDEEVYAQAVRVIRHILKTKKLDHDREELAAKLGVRVDYVIEVFKLLKRFRHLPEIKDQVNEVLQLKPTWRRHFQGKSARAWRKDQKNPKGETIVVEQTPIVQEPEQTTKKKPPSIEQYLERNPPREGEPVDAETVAAVCETNLGYTKKTISILGFYHKTSPKYLRMLKAKNKAAGSQDTREPTRRSSPEPVEPVKKKRGRGRIKRKVEKPTPIVFTKPLKKPGKRGRKTKDLGWVARTRSFVLSLFGFSAAK